MGLIKSLTSNEAESIMAAAMKLLKSKGKVASISIVNRDRAEIASAMMDGVKPYTANVAHLKAKQSAFTGKSTRATRDQIKEGEVTAEVLGLEPNYVVPWAGGEPIYDTDGDLLGGIGVSNLDQDEDEEIAIVAVVDAGLKVIK